MKINCGIENGAVLQRRENIGCECYIELETTGEAGVSLGKLECMDGEKGLFRLTGIAVGGPYSITFSDDTDSVTLKDIYVGDLWLAAGQSNMQGVGHMTAEDHLIAPEAHVRARYMSDEWKEAHPLLHHLELSDDPVVLRHKGMAEPRADRRLPKLPLPAPCRGVGPGYFFAKELYDKTGVPQGILPCGMGGSNMISWDPNGGDNNYTMSMRYIKKAGGRVRGIFWYQGEAETNAADSELFVQRMQQMIASYRNELDDAKLPVVQVQISHTNIYNQVHNAAWDRYWSVIREKQRNLKNEIPYLDTVFSSDAELDDCIHLSSDSCKKVGRRAARSMMALCGWGGNIAPEFDGLFVETDHFEPTLCNVTVKYKNLDGALCAEGKPCGFSITLSEEEAISVSHAGISRVVLNGDNTVTLRTWYTPEQIEKAALWYNHSNNTYCNIVDEGGNAIPAMGPIKISDYLSNKQ